MHQLQAHSQHTDTHLISCASCSPLVILMNECYIGTFLWQTSTAPSAVCPHTGMLQSLHLKGKWLSGGERELKVKVTPKLLVTKVLICWGRRWGKRKKNGRATCLNCSFIFFMRYTLIHVCTHTSTHCSLIMQQVHSMPYILITHTRLDFYTSEAILKPILNSCPDATLENCPHVVLFLKLK